MAGSDEEDAPIDLDGDSEEDMTGSGYDDEEDAPIDLASDEEHAAGPDDADGESDNETEAGSSFKQDYRKSIAPVLALVERLIGRAVWSGNPLETHRPASESEMAAVVGILRKLSPLVGNQLKIDSSNIKKHPGIQKVLDNHSRGSAYMRQLFKIPLEAPCDCMACRKGLFSPLVMPFQAYQEMSALPLPIPQQQASTGTVRDLHYITLEQAMTRQFTAEHQPSLMNRKAARASNAHAGVFLAGRETRNDSSENKTTQAKYVRGVVECKECMKPRCIYSTNAPARMKPPGIDGRWEGTDQGSHQRVP